jgi:hypothetical protein
MLPPRVSAYRPPEYFSRHNRVAGYLDDRGFVAQADGGEQDLPLMFVHL